MAVIFRTKPSALPTEILETRAQIQSGTSRPPARGARHHWPFDSGSSFGLQPNYVVLYWVIAVLLFAASGKAAQPSATPSGRTWQSNGSAANVQQIHDRQAFDGDTIVIPEGTFSWTTTVRITKKLTLQGQSTSDAPASNTSDDKTIIIDNIPLAANNGLIEMENSIGGQRITGITFKGGRAQMQSNGLIRVGGTTPTRIDHCVFDHVYFSPMIGWFSPNFGVIDHCVKRNPISNEGLVHCYMPTIYGGQHGDGAFERTAGYGGPDFLFVEDNWSAGGIDVSHGGKACVRHNKFMQANIASHGTGQSWVDGRGARAVEIYDNEWNLAPGYQALTGSAGGGAVLHDNRIIPSSGYSIKGIDMQVYRMIYSYGAPFYGADGANAWDYNATEKDGTHVDGHTPYLFDSGTFSAAAYPHLTDGMKNWTPNQWAGYCVRRPSDGVMSLITGNTATTLTVATLQSPQGWDSGNRYEIHKVLRILDQPGLGKQTGTMDRANPRWMQQATEPCYSWNNKDQNNNLVNFITAIGGMTIIEGRDYFNNTPMPGYTPYVYPHPVTTSPPTQSKAGVTLGSQRHFYKEKNEARKARRKKWGKAKENLANEMAPPDQ